MTDGKRNTLLKSAIADLKDTREGYVTSPNGPFWRSAMAKLEQLSEDLSKPPVPALGPVLEGGPSMLTYSPTHDTDGVSGYPAFDAGFNQRGRWILAPELVKVTRQSGAQGGDAVYLEGRSGIKYWLGHIGVPPATGRIFKKGEKIARIADQAGTDHVHWGLDVRPLTGKSLLYGRDGNGPDYTWGSPTIGVQLTKMLAT